MASFCATAFDSRGNGWQRLVVAFAACCTLSLAHAQSDVSAAPPPSPSALPNAFPPPDVVANAAPAEAPLVTEENSAATIASTEQLVKSTEQQFGKNTRQTAEAYMDLAEAQRRGGDREAAEKSYLTAIEIYRAYDGPFTPLAIAPLTSLGDHYQEGRDYRDAITAYAEARTINRRAFGLLNEDQVPLLDRMTRTYVEMDQPIEADQQQLEALKLVERNRPPESDEALSALYKYAGWLRETRRYQEERDYYMRAVRTIRDRYGKDDPRQVKGLLGIGNSFRVQRIPDPQGIGALREALTLQIAETNPDPLTVAQTLRDLGDWAVAFSKVDYAGDEYRRAWELLGNVPNGEALRKEWFTGAIRVLEEPISQRGLSHEENALKGRVLVRFDLDKSGRTQNVAVVESEPAGLKDEAVLRHIRRSRFRPQMENGELVEGKAIGLLFTYEYTPDAVAENKDGESRKK
jgi:TonB family protein